MLTTTGRTFIGALVIGLFGGIVFWLGLGSTSTAIIAGFSMGLGYIVGRSI